MYYFILWYQSGGGDRSFDTTRAEAKVEKRHDEQSREADEQDGRGERARAAAPRAQGLAATGDAGAAAGHEQPRGGRAVRGWQVGRRARARCTAAAPHTLDGVRLPSRARLRVGPQDAAQRARIERQAPPLYYEY